MKLYTWAIAIIVFAVFSVWAQEKPDASPDPAPTTTPTTTPTLKPDPSPVYRPDAVKLYGEGKYQQAIEVCKQELQANALNKYSYVVIGWSMIKLGRFEEALQYSRTGVERVGLDKEILANFEEASAKLTDQLYNQGKFDEALVQVRHFIAYLPTSSYIAAAYARMGDIYIKKGNYIYADTALSYAIYLNRNVNEWWVSAGFAREKSGDYKNALAAFNKAVALDPNHQEALRGRDRVREKISP